jgi:RimJ/RimL family protein N-acetyltransferase
MGAMGMLEDVTLTGTRVQLVPLELGHLEGLFAAGNDREIWKYLPSKMESLEDMKGIVLEALRLKANGMQVPFTVIDLQTKEIIGTTRFLNMALSSRNLEIGSTWYSLKVWRTSVNTECKYLLLKYCFEQLGLVRVQFRADVRNERSNRAIKRIGAKHEGILRKDRILHDGHIRDTNSYSIIEEEWLEVKDRFERQLLKD